MEFREATDKLVAAMDEGADVSHMMKTPGWKVFIDKLNNLARAKQQHLIKHDPADTVGIMKLQMEIDLYGNFIENLAIAIEKEGDLSFQKFKKQPKNLVFRSAK